MKQKLLIFFFLLFLLIAVFAKQVVKIPQVVENEETEEREVHISDL